MLFAVNHILWSLFIYFILKLILSTLRVSHFYSFISSFRAFKVMWSKEYVTSLGNMAASWETLFLCKPVHFQPCGDLFWINDFFSAGHLILEACSWDEDLLWESEPDHRSFGLGGGERRVRLPPGDSQVAPS